MKKRKLINISLMTLMILSASQTPLTVFTQNVVSAASQTVTPQTGTLGTSHWELDANGVLTIHAGTFVASPGCPWSTYQNQIIKIVFDGPVIAAANSQSLFNNLSNVTEIDGLDNLDTSNVTNMSSMFNGMSALTSLDLSHFDTKKADVTELFKNTSSLSRIILGPKVRFGTHYRDPFDDVPTNSQYLGKWQDVGNGTPDHPTGSHVFTSDELMSQYNGATMAGTYVWQPNQSEIKLHDSTIHVGDTWNKADNFTSAKAKDGTALAIADMTVTGTVDTSKAGDYTIHYTHDGLDKTAKVTVLAKSTKPSSTTNSSSTKPSTSNKPTIPSSSAIKPPTTTHQAVVNYQAVYRLYNKNTGEHFYTESAFERDALVKGGWNNEGIGWSAPNKGTAVYRVYNPNVTGGDHYYTASQYEAQSLVKTGWKWDNAGKPVFYSGGKTPVYVAFNPNATASGSHNYTSNAFEQNSLLKNGWKFGKVQFYGR